MIPFLAGLATGVAATCAGLAIAWRWLAPHVPVTGPIDTALTPVDVDWDRTVLAPTMTVAYRPATPDDSTGDVTDRDELQRIADLIDKLPDGSMTIDLDNEIPDLGPMVAYWPMDERGPTTHYPPFSTHHDLTATEHDDGTTTYGPDADR